MTSRSEIVLDIKSLIADTYMLSTTEFGAYALLLFAMHSSSDGWIDESDMQRVAHMADQNRNWQRVRTALERFLIMRDGRVTQKRIQRDRQFLSQTQDGGSESDSGKKSLAHIESNSHPLRLPLLTGDTGESLSRSQKKRTLAHQIPEDWSLSSADDEYARGKGFTADKIEDLAESFYAHHRGKGTRWTNWHLAWVTWVKNELKWNKRSGGGNGKRSINDAWDKLSGVVEGAEDNTGGQTSLLSLPPRSIR